MKATSAWAACGMVIILPLLGLADEKKPDGPSEDNASATALKKRKGQQGERMKVFQSHGKPKGKGPKGNDEKALKEGERDEHAEGDHKERGEKGKGRRKHDRTKRLMSGAEAPATPPEGDQSAAPTPAAPGSPNADERKEGNGRPAEPGNEGRGKRRR